MVLRLWEDFVDGDEALEEIEAAEFSYAAEVSTMEGVCGGCDGSDRCSALEGEGGPPSRRQLATPPCLKCGGTRAQFVARQREPLCRTCMEESIQNKIKAAILRPGKRGSASLTQDDTLAVACSGGFNSMAMVHVLTNLAEMEAQRARPRFRRGLKVIHVVTSDSSSDSVASVGASVAAIDPTIAYFAVPLRYVVESDERLRELVLGGGSQLQGSSGEPRSAEDLDLNSIIEGCSLTVSARASMGRLLVKLLCLRVAKVLGSSKLALGCNATYFAMHTLASILRGSGFALPAELQYLDSRFGSWSLPAIIHPLRDSVSKELLLTCYLHGVAFVSSERDIAGDRTDVKSLCKDFIFTAQDRLPSTVLTVMKTVLKLDYNGITEEEMKVLDGSGMIKREKMCQLCSSPMCTLSKHFALSQQQRQNGPERDTELQERFCYSCCSMFEKIDKNFRLWSEAGEQTSILRDHFGGSSGRTSDVLNGSYVSELVEEIKVMETEVGGRYPAIAAQPVAVANNRRGMTCAYCRENRAMLKRPKTKESVCKECFYRAFEEEIHQTIVNEKLFTRGDRVAIGASGGKDSTVLIHVLKTLNERYDYGLELFLLSVDEGIKGYRDDSLETVARNEQQYEIPLEVVSYKDLYGYSMDEIVTQIGLRNNCTFCGVFRRQALDRGAVLLNANKIVTGHNADDIAETVFLNVLRGDFPRLTRCTNSITGEDSALPRCKPFKYTYEKEIVMYAFHKKLDYFATECIYSPQAYRGVAREFIKDVEIVEPVCILNAIISGDEMKLGANSERMMQVQGQCTKCGYITSQKVCKACVLLEGLNSGNALSGMSRQACQPLHRH